MKSTRSRQPSASRVTEAILLWKSWQMKQRDSRISLPLPSGSKRSPWKRDKSLQRTMPFCSAKSAEAF